MDRQVEMQRCTYFAKQNGHPLYRVRVADFVVDVRPFTREISHEEFTLTNVLEHDIGNSALMFDIVSPDSLNLEVFKNLFDADDYILQFWFGQIHPHYDERGIWVLGDEGS